ncbi:hypothetical protein [Leuconostoc lactis]|uniref:hypothetical protein n=1 Tax=Leuconostoc lactis TaxID=1246 RepID=UPI0006DC303C|nr:hypothetical protein [Leuconostoc lactis]KQB82667.1 hypothetical protein AN225_02300 [Leuconostoc lactis]
MPFDLDNYDLSPYVDTEVTRDDMPLGNYADFSSFRQDNYDQIINDIDVSFLPFNEYIDVQDLLHLEKQLPDLNWNSIKSKIEIVVESENDPLLDRSYYNEGILPEDFINLLTKSKYFYFPSLESLSDEIDEYMTKLGIPNSNDTYYESELPVEYQYWPNQLDEFDEFDEFYFSKSNAKKTFMELTNIIHTTDSATIKLALIFSLLSISENYYKSYLANLATHNMPINNQYIKKLIQAELERNMESRKKLYRGVNVDEAILEEPQHILRNKLAHSFDEVSVDKDMNISYVHKGNAQKVAITHVLDEIENFIDELDGRLEIYK